MYKFAVVVILVCVGSAGLFLSSVGLADSTPSWFPGADPIRFPPERYIVGVGRCDASNSVTDRAACAAQKALEEVALSIRSQVTAQRERRMDVTVTTANGKADGQSKATYSQRGGATAQVDLEDVRTVSASCTQDGSCYALAVVERAAYVARLRRKYQGLAKQVEQALLTASNGSPVDRLAAGDRAIAVTRSMDDVAALMAAVGDASAAPPAALPSVMSRRAEAMRDLTVCLIGAPAEVRLSVVFENARSALAALGVASISMVEATSDGCSSNALAIMLDATWERRDSDTLAVADLHGSLSFRVGAKTLAGSRPVMGHGVARSAERARQDAEQKIAEAIGLAVRETLTQEAGSGS